MRTFDEIERERRAAGITRKALYEAAEVHHSTYGRNAKGETGSPLASTVAKLDRALTGLIAKASEPAE